MKDKLVIKNELADTVPQQIAYTTTTKGEELLEVIVDLHRWEMRWIQNKNTWKTL